MNLNHEPIITDHVHPSFAYNSHGYPSHLRRFVIVYLIIDFFTLIVSIINFGFISHYLGDDERYGCFDYNPTNWLVSAFALTIISEMTYVTVIVVFLISSLMFPTLKGIRSIYLSRLNPVLQWFLVFSRLGLIISLIGLLDHHRYFVCTRDNGERWIFTFTPITVLAIMQVIGCLLWFIARLVVVSVYKVPKVHHTHTTNMPSEIHIEKDSNHIHVSKNVEPETNK